MPPAALLALLAAASARAGVYEIDDMEQLFGATNVVAMAGNGGLTAGVSKDGEITVLRWPSPSYLDHLRYRTSDDEDARELPHYGAAENEGAFAGLLLPAGGVTWLRDLAPRTIYAGPTSATVRTVAEGGGVSVTQDLAIDPVRDLLALRWRVDAAGGADRLVFFANLAPCLTRLDRYPIADWYDDGLNDFGAVYLQDVDAVVHFLPEDASATWEEGATSRDAATVASRFPEEAARMGPGVYLAWGFEGGSTAWQVGLDANENCGRDGEHQPRDAYEDAADGDLSGSPQAACQVDAALAAPVAEGGQVGILLAVSDTLEGALALLAEGRDLGVDAVIAAADDDAAAWLAGSDPIPGVPDAWKPFLDRTLLAIHQATDRETGAIVASITTQPPYAQDWPRDSAFFNAALDLAGLHDEVSRHNRFLASVQATEQDGDTPAGAWYMNYYADGRVGGFIPFEIDEVGLALWTLWNHAAFLSDPGERAAYLADTWPAIERGAELLTTCVDEATGLQCYANEDDDIAWSRTIHGAGTTLLGLRSAVEAAEATCADTGLRERWTARAEELLAAIEEVLWSEEAGTFLPEGATGVGDPPVSADAGWWLWPEQGWPRDDPRMDAHAAILEAGTRAILEGEGEGGAYVNKATLGLAMQWRDRPGDLARVEELVDILVTEVPMPTWQVGEVFVTDDFDGDGAWEFDNRVATPHLWAATLTWLSAAALHDPERFAPFDADGADLAVCDAAGCGGCAAPGGGWAPAGWPLVMLASGVRRRRPGR